ncbi:MAG TPA: site-specific integrase [Smithellaceae bacterium]|jgi:integrase|nr:site-specific integrase [Smithellaceae bacterium]HQF84199.1 site-specific integrase [Smithellaceae bacterium]HQG79479.1 site-specific integrase [Smithellaceae bacterium]
MKRKWIGSKYKGVRFYEHPSRKHGVKRDRYIAIRYQKGGKRVEEGIGWTSERDPEDGQYWTEAKAALLLERLKGAARHGAKGAPTRISEKRKIEADRREAERAAQEQAEKESVTFDDFMIKNYLPQSQRDKKERTYKTEESLYRLYLADTIGTLPFSQISAFHLERVKKEMVDKKKSERTIQYVLQLTRQAFNAARKLGIFVGASPTDAVKWPRLDNMKLRYLSISEAEKLLAALAEKSQNLHDMALLSLHCGLRFGEISALTWSCVNLEQGTLTILNAKAGSRTAYLTERASAMFKARGKGQPDELVFTKRGKKTVGKIEQVSKSFTDTIKELGFNEGIIDRKQHVTFHTLRHTYATHLYESTHDLYLTQRALGHATGTMTARYAKMSENRLREGAAAFEKAFTVNGENNAGQVLPLTE